MVNKKHTGKKSRSGEKRVSFTIIIAVVMIIFCTGFIIQAVFFSNTISLKNTEISRPLSGTDPFIENQVNHISNNFRCACGGCGEMQLIECECDMPRGAQEEKAFMRQKLGEGLSVEQIILLVDKKYGYRNL